MDAGKLRNKFADVLSPVLSQRMLPIQSIAHLSDLSCDTGTLTSKYNPLFSLITLSKFRKLKKKYASDRGRLRVSERESDEKAVRLNKLSLCCCELCSCPSSSSSSKLSHTHTPPLCHPNCEKT